MSYRASFTAPYVRGIIGFIITIGLSSVPRTALSQGCVPAHYVSLTLGAQGVNYLSPGQWEADVSYRFLHSERVFIGSEEQPQLYNVGGRLTINSIDVSATYEVSSRFSLSLTLPSEHADYSTIQGDGQRHTGSSGGIGDMRLVANTWLFKPVEHPNGNLNLGLGVKFPTGNDRATADFHTLNGVLIRPVDIAAQLGDGGWGMILELQGFQKIVGNLFGYLDGFYLINPRNTNGTERPSPALPQVNSVPDEYVGRGGLSYLVWPGRGLSVSLGARIDGVPVHDVVGGSDGFRRAGYSIYIDPGVNWVFGKNVLSVNVPVAVARNFVPLPGAPFGGLADYIVVASFSHRF